MHGINLKLQGQFKLDLHRPDGTLIKTTDYFDNFITNSGVMYPYHFAFADCFRFLSVGVGTTPNSVTTVGSTPTTGLASPLSPYLYIGSRNGFYSGKDGSYYAQPGNMGAGCGYVNTPSGVSLIRQWNLPDNTGGFFPSAITLNEFMVSPGRPYVTGFGSNGYPSGACSCNDFVSDGHGNTLTGMDCSSVAEYYNWVQAKYNSVNRAQRLRICDATAAFSRIVSGFTVEADSILTVTYRLNITVDTGINFTSLYYSRGDSNPNWNKLLNSVSSITQPGVMLINNGIVTNSIAPNGNRRAQHFDYSNTNGHDYNFDYEYGESFVPPHGAPLEPSNIFLLNDPNNQNIVVYMSDDNLQFLVSPTGGPFLNTGNYAPWTGTTGIPFTSGVRPFRNDNDAAIYSGSRYWSARPNSFNIRTQTGYAPNTSDITQAVGMNANTYTAPNASLPTFNFTVTSTGVRNASVGYVYSFQNYRGSSSMQARSFVAAYKDISLAAIEGNGDTTNLVPFFDALFSGTSGNADGIFIPRIETGASIVAGGTGAIVSGANLSDYNILASYTNSVYPIINTLLSWSVPCPPGVNGC